MKKLVLTLFCLLNMYVTGLSQDISLLEQFNGRYDYIALGNTLNIQENGGGDPCVILTESSATLTLTPTQNVIAAYLYWAGSLDPGDLDVTLNNIPVTASRDFSISLTSGANEYIYFAAFADVTSVVQASGSGTYTLSDLDLTADIDYYCNGNSTNFGGWAISVIYEDPALSLKNVSVFDGLQAVSANENDLTIVLENLNVIDDEGAKIGFIAWEGDAALAIEETLSINGNIISNPPLNPANNAFNGTNSFTNSSDLYNMDIDFYDIENNISPGDTQVVIDLTSGQDFVMINQVITVLNTELPDATIEIDNISGGTVCDDFDITMDYTVFNTNSTAPLPAATPIAFYANTTLVGQSQTNAEIPIDGNETGTINITLPTSTPSDFTWVVVVDDTGNNTGIVEESNESNNNATQDFSILKSPNYTLQNLEQCDAVGIESFNLFDAISYDDTLAEVTFYTTLFNAENEIDDIPNPSNYFPTTNPETLYVRIDNDDCPLTDSFTVFVEICPLPDATIELDSDVFPCRRRPLEVNYTVFNTLGTDILPANTPISFYGNSILLGTAATFEAIPIGGSENGTIILNLQNITMTNFSIIAVVDDSGNGTGIVEELDETNNDDSIKTSFGSLPEIPPLPDLLACNMGNTSATFDLTENEALVLQTAEGNITYYETLEDAVDNVNAIDNIFDYEITTPFHIIYVRLENEICFTTANFRLVIENCPPFIPEGFSPNEDGVNDVFEISNLLDIFEDFELQIFNRYGSLIYKGGNDLGHWNGIPNEGLLYKEEVVPTGTYYYVLQLNDSEFPEAFVGFVYVNY